MRDHLAHRYFDTDHAIIQATIDHDLPPLIAATERLTDTSQHGKNTPEEIQPRWLLGATLDGASN